MSQSTRNLFLSRAYFDCREEYTAALRDPHRAHWDFLVLTAADEAQADAYRRQLDLRLAAGQLSPRTEYLILPDPGGRRIGSGGATLAALREIAARRGTADFSGLRILMIHSGGDCRRIPQYGPSGKLFSPVPRILPDGRRSTLFDELCITVGGLPARMGEGMLVCSGDVLLLLNPLQLTPFATGAAAISTREPAAVGARHGVFLSDGAGCVRRFLHKLSPEALSAAGAVENGEVDIDTGAVIFSTSMIHRLFSLVDTEEKLAATVNDEVRLSFYADFLYPLATDACLADYLAEPAEGTPGPALRQARERVWEALHGERIRLFRFAPAAFLHFGTTVEILRLMTEEIDDYRFLSWERQLLTNAEDGDFAASLACIEAGAQVGRGSYIEDACLAPGATVGEGCVVACTSLPADVTLPHGCVLHGLRLRDGRFVARLFAVSDNPKEAQLFGRPIDGALWGAPLYPARADMESAVRATLARIFGGDETPEELFSLESSLRAADLAYPTLWQGEVLARMRAATLLSAIDRRAPLSAVAALFPHGELTPRVRDICRVVAEATPDTTVEGLARVTRIYAYLSHLAGDAEDEEACFAAVRRAILSATPPPHPIGPMQERVAVDLPLRVNFGGGWTDTPPYCMEQGGSVLNTAILLNGVCPVTAEVVRLSEPVIVLENRDAGVVRSYSELSELSGEIVATEPFALHRAALLAGGVVAADATGPVAACPALCGGGLRLITKTKDIPRGSGLGTSSILAAACLLALARAFREEPETDELVARTLLCEQLMTTGGGWQDQAGGITPGIKLVSTRPGLRQNITVEPISPSPALREELSRRFVLIYTGTCRLARNILRSVEGRYLTAEPDCLAAISRIAEMAREMRDALMREDLDAFAALMDEHFERSRQLDSSCVDNATAEIFRSCGHLLSGRTVCGAGGGGFLQAILRPGVTVEQLAAHLAAAFPGAGIQVHRGEIAY